MKNLADWRRCQSWGCCAGYNGQAKHYYVTLQLRLMLTVFPAIPKYFVPWSMKRRPDRPRTLNEISDIPRLWCGRFHTSVARQWAVYWRTWKINNDFYHNCYCFEKMKWRNENEIIHDNINKNIYHDRGDKENILLHIITGDRGDKWQLSTQWKVLILYISKCLYFRREEKW